MIDYDLKLDHTKIIPQLNVYTEFNLNVYN